MDNNKEVIALIKELDKKYEELRATYNAILEKTVIVNGVETVIDMGYDWEMGNFEITAVNYPDKFDNDKEEMFVDSDEFIELLKEG